MKNWKTTLAFAVAALFQFISQAWPETSAWALPVSSAALAIGGVVSKDAKSEP